jgi:hypothetical protein
MEVIGEPGPWLHEHTHLPRLKGDTTVAHVQAGRRPVTCGELITGVVGVKIGQPQRPERGSRAIPPAREIPQPSRVDEVRVGDVRAGGGALAGGVRSKS